MKIIHDAFLDFFRYPNEPIVIGNSVRLKIAIEKQENVKVSKVCLRYNFANEWNYEYVIDMNYESQDGSFIYYVCDVKIDQIKTIYYFFTVEYVEVFDDVIYNKYVFVEKIGDINSYMFNSSYVSFKNSDISKWELSFYDNSKFAPIRDVAEIYYSIFPDRFNRSENYFFNVDCMPNRVIHENLEELPVYLPNRDGIVENNDFFLGNLKGITEKMDYFDSLNVTIIYINPIFYAKSNHRYDTLDYLKIDPFLGMEDDFYELCRVAHEHGKKVIIDFVPNHVSCDSEYAKKYDRGTCWWGIRDLVEINLYLKEIKEFFLKRFIPKWLDDRNSNVDKADGVRCDVPDEYPLGFIYDLYNCVKSISKEKLVIFEEWEHASSKNIYGLRNYFQGNMCDGVMNYELKDAMLAFICSSNSTNFANVCKSQLQTYPKEARQNLMNIADTHDSIRIITNIGNKPYVQKGDFRNPAILTADRIWQVSNMFMSDADYKKAKDKLKLFLMIQYTMFGNPVIYYGSEVGMEGYLDPTNRRYHIFDKGDMELLKFYQNLGDFRGKSSYLAYADTKFLVVEDGFIVYERYTKDKSLIVAINVSNIPKNISEYSGYENVFCSGNILDNSMLCNSGIFLEKSN